MPEIVYLLTNPSMPTLVKVGRTTSLEDRLRSLSSHSGVPVPFEVFYACEVKDSSKVEQSIHEGFGDHLRRKSERSCTICLPSNIGVRKVLRFNTNFL